MYFFPCVETPPHFSKQENLSLSHASSAEIRTHRIQNSTQCASFTTCCQICPASASYWLEKTTFHGDTTLIILAAQILLYPKSTSCTRINRLSYARPCFCTSHAAPSLAIFGIHLIIHPLFFQNLTPCLQCIDKSGGAFNTFSVTSWACLRRAKIGTFS